MLCFIAKIIVISQKIFVLQLFKMMKNPKDFSGLEQKSVITFLRVEKYKPGEIYKRMFDVDGEACFNKKKFGFFNWLKHGFLNMNLSRKNSPWRRKHSHSTVKKKVLGAIVSKEGPAGTRKDSSLIVSIKSLQF